MSSKVACDGSCWLLSEHSYTFAPASLAPCGLVLVSTRCVWCVSGPCLWPHLTVGSTEALQVWHRGGVLIPSRACLPYSLVFVSENPEWGFRDLFHNIGHFTEQVWQFLVFVCKVRRVRLSAVVDVQGGSNVPPMNRSSRRRPLSSPLWCVFFDGFVYIYIYFFFASCKFCCNSVLSFADRGVLSCTCCGDFWRVRSAPTGRDSV